jgi:hypothetical protein
MSLPDKGSVHVNRPLTNMSLGNLQDEAAYAVYQTFPVVPSQAQGNSYYKYNEGDWFRDVMEKRAPGAETPGVGYRVTTDNFFCDLWGVHHDVPDQNRANQDEPLDEDLDAANLCVQAAMIRLEKQWNDDVMKTGVWWRDVVGASSSSGSTQVKYWSDPTADPIGDIELQVKDGLAKTGKKYNTLTMGYEVWSKLKNHPNVLNRMTPGQTGLSGKPSEVSQELFAAVCGLDKVVVSTAVYNSAARARPTPWASSSARTPSCPTSPMPRAASRWPPATPSCGRATPA